MIPTNFFFNLLVTLGYNWMNELEDCKYNGC